MSGAHLGPRCPPSPPCSWCGSPLSPAPASADLSAMLMVQCRWQLQSQHQRQIHAPGQRLPAEPQQVLQGLCSLAQHISTSGRAMQACSWVQEGRPAEPWEAIPPSAGAAWTCGWTRTARPPAAHSPRAAAGGQPPPLACLPAHGHPAVNGLTAGFLLSAAPSCCQWSWAMRSPSGSAGLCSM